MTGYLQQNPVTEKFTFVVGDYAGYDTQATGTTATQNVMTIGGQALTSPALAAGLRRAPRRAHRREPGPAGQPVVHHPVQREPPAGRKLRPSQLLQQAISGYPGSPGGSLVFLQTIGTPFTGNSFPIELANAITQLGGNGTALYNPSPNNGYNGTDQPRLPASYAFVGGVALTGPLGLGTTLPTQTADSTLQNSNAGGSLSGGVRRGADWFYTPYSASSVSSVAPNLSLVAYEAPQPWPYSSTQGQRDALVYITQQTLASNYVFEQGKDCFVPPAGPPTCARPTATRRPACRPRRPRSRPPCPRA